METINQPISEVLLSVREDGAQDAFERKSMFRGSKRFGRRRKTVKISDEEPILKYEEPLEKIYTATTKESCNEHTANKLNISSEESAVICKTWDEETKISSDVKNKDSINMQKQSENELDINETTAVLKSSKNKSELTATEKEEESIVEFEIENKSRAYQDETISASVKPFAEETVKPYKENKTVPVKTCDGELLASVESERKPSCQATTDLVKTYEKEAAALVESCLKAATEIVKSSNKEIQIQVKPCKETPVELCKKQPTLAEGSPCIGEFPVKVPQNKIIPARPDRKEAATLIKQYTTDTEPCGKNTLTMEKSCNQEKDAPVTLSIDQEAKVKPCNDEAPTPKNHVQNKYLFQLKIATMWHPLW